MNTGGFADPIKTLLIEDNPGDVKIIKTLLSEFQEISVDHADNLEKGMNSLRNGNYNSLLLDLNLPDSKGVNTLVSILIKFPEYPIVVLTGYDEAELGVLSVQSGAQDYLNKKYLNGSLIIHSLRYAIERHKLVNRLKQSLREIDRLRGLLLICMHCKKIRDDKGYWSQIEQYIGEHSNVQFSHGLCPDCFRKYSGQIKKTK